MSFSSELANFAAKTIRRNNAIVRKIVLDMGTQLVLRTPVGNPRIWQNPNGAPSGYAGGAARANWQYSNGQIADSVLNLIDANGSLTIKKIEAGLKSSPASSVHWISNNLPYIKRLEEGYSTQAPQGMLRLTVIDFKDTVESAAKQLR